MSRSIFFVTFLFMLIMALYPFFSVFGQANPVPIISFPLEGATYNAGQVISFEGTATDPQDGDLPATSFSWMIVFHHNTHTHPAVGPITGVKNGSFDIPDQGESSPEVWFRVHLTVTNSGGKTTSVFRDVLPNKSTNRISTVPNGLMLKLDGQPINTPYTFLGVVGLKRDLDIIDDQSLNGKLYRFASWSDGLGGMHTITTPATDTQYVATFQEVANCLKRSSGDANCDNLIDLIDFELFRKELTGVSLSKSSDFNGDTAITILDFEVWRKGYFGVLLTPPLASIEA